MISLNKDTINKEDIDRLINWLKTYPRLTKGEVTIQLEEKWSNWINRKYSIFCNSGSSANLLMLNTLLEAQLIQRGDKVVVPALGWATDLSPVMQLALEPIICDINLKDLSVCIQHLENIFIKEKPKVLLLVSILGFPPEMDLIVELCEKYDVILLEDACESMGSKYKEKNIGTFGLMASFSTYYGHHISTIEGGFVSTDNENMRNILLSTRSHGWDRDLDKKEQAKLRKKWNITEFNSLYTFYYSGLNVRATDLQAYIGLSQIDKLQHVCEKRNKNFLLYDSEIQNTFCKIQNKKECFISNFAYPIIHPNRNKMIASLIENDIETRPLLCGSLATQPFYIKKYKNQKLKNVSIIDSYGFYIPNHPLLTEKDIKHVSKLIMEYC